MGLRKEVLLCESCGANEFESQGNYWVCSFCGTKFLICEDGKHSSSGSTIITVAGTAPGKKSNISLDDDIRELLEKCRKEPKKARRYANRILDLDPTNEEALFYLLRR